MSERNIVVQKLSRPSIEENQVEICEHKGVGHPDTICDGVCEAASRALSREYLNKFGKVLHHNVDKALLVAGKSSPQFSGGNFDDKIKLIICGRATANFDNNPDNHIDVKSICLNAAKDWISANLRSDIAHFDLRTEVKEGSGNLKEVFNRSNTVPLANDTSFGVGFAPHSRLEAAVLDTARFLNSKEFISKFPSVGDDFKVMGLRKKDSIHLTICIAFIDKHITDTNNYFETKQKIIEEIKNHLSVPATVDINTLDDKDSSSVDGIYLTVSGLSAEMGDDGQVGRGNRVNGLITPNRVTSLEAAAGKNPTSHVGKIYNLLAGLIARDIYGNIDEVKEAHVQLLSAIGKHIDEPQVASVEVLTEKVLSDDLKEKIERITDGWLQNIIKVTNLVINEDLSVH